MVLSKYLKPWCIKFDNSYIIPSPWYRLGLQIVYPVFMNWAGTILNKIFENPGSSVATIAENLDYITPRSVQEICTFLQNCECVQLKSLVDKAPDLFSDDDDIFELSSYNEYGSPNTIMVFPLKDCILKFVNMKLNIKQFCVET